MALSWVGNSRRSPFQPRLSPVWPGSLDGFSYRKSLLELHFVNAID